MALELDGGVVADGHREAIVSLTMGAHGGQIETRPDKSEQIFIFAPTKDNRS